MDPKYKPGLAEGAWVVASSGHEWNSSPGLTARYRDRRVTALYWAHVESQEHGSNFPLTHYQGDWITELPAKTPGERDKRIYDPLSAKGLLRRFLSIPFRKSQTEETKAAILEFVNEFGLLGVNQVNMKDSPFVLWAERLDDWRSRIYHFNLLMRAYGLLTDWSEDSDKELAKLVKTSPVVAFDTSEAESEGLDRHVISRATLHPNMLGQADTTVREEAYRLVSGHINDALDNWARIHIELFENAPLVIIPVNLLGALYVSLALEIVGKKPSARLCQAPGCTKLISNHDARAIYCSPRCKERAKSANRRARARKEKEEHEQ